MREVALVTLYFAASFLCITVIKMLFLAEFGLHPVAITKALLGALVTGKIVVVLDKTSLGDRFRRHALWLDVLYKAIVYSFVVIFVTAAEHVVAHHLEDGTWSEAFSLAVEASNLYRFMGVAACLFLTFLGYSVLSAIASHFGEEKLMNFLLDPKARHEERVR